MQQDFILTDQEEELTHSFLEEFLQREGYSFETIGKLPPERLKQVMTRASLCVSMKLAEIQDRAQLVTSLHHTTESLT